MVESTNKLDFKESMYATGRRKKSIAKIWLKKGSGKIFVNGKNYNDYSIPVLAKFALNYGIGINTHQLSVPSISVLKDEYDTEDLNYIYDQISQNMYFDFTVNCAKWK